MAFFTPWDVYPSYRKFALFVFFVLIAGYAVLAILSTINVLDRLLRAPLEMTCVTFFFRYPAALKRIDWLGEFYVLYNLTLNPASNPPMNKTGLISKSLVAYFSDTGNSTLESEACFIRDKRVRDLENSPERFEQGGVILPENKRSDFSLVRRVRKFIAGVHSVQYMVDSGGVVSYDVPEPGLVGSLAAEHGNLSVVANGLSGVLMNVGINFDEIGERETDIRTGLFTLLGTLGGQVTWFTAALALIFIEERDGPYMTISFPFRMLLKLFYKAMRKEDRARQSSLRADPSGGEEVF